MPRSLRLLALLLLFVGTAVGCWYIADRIAHERAEAAYEAYRLELAAILDSALVAQAAAIHALSQQFETVDDLKAAQESQLRRYRNAVHVSTARQHGVGRVTGSEHIGRLVAEGRLVQIEDNPYYRIKELDYSVPYVTPETAAVLEEIGQRFQARLAEQGLPRYRYVISSVLRTADNQAALRRVNVNAASGVSSHEFGTTFDIVFHTYDYVPALTDTPTPTTYPFFDEKMEDIRRRAFSALGMYYWQELQGVLGRVLIEMQQEDTLIVVLERRQPVFHITVAQ